MKKETQEWLMVLVLILLLISSFIVADQRDSLKQEAVDKGFAEWQFVQGTNKTIFKWKNSVKNETNSNR